MSDYTEVPAVAVAEAAASRKLLPARDCIYPIFCDWYFVIMLTVTMTLCVGVNCFIDYFVYRHKSPEQWAVSGPDTLGDYMVFAFILSFLIFGGSGSIQERIKEKRAAPVAADVYTSSCAKRFFLFAMGEARWKRRLPLFVWQALLVPTVFLYVILVFGCWAHMGFPSKMSQYGCQVSLGEFVAFRGLMHGIIAAFL